ncbi:hypothetical protein [Streptomyces sp. NPDC050355]|uniref:Secreted protein n=1 Tax=Streptomyces sirii TaxID=3127701 RepID=A0ABZ2QU34_9ACTN
MVTLSLAVSVAAALSTWQSVMRMSDSGGVVDPEDGEPVVVPLVVVPLVVLPELLYPPLDVLPELYSPPELLLELLELWLPPQPPPCEPRAPVSATTTSAHTATARTWRIFILSSPP